MKKLGLLKENTGVGVVTLTPANVKSLSGKYLVLVQKMAGRLAGFEDEEFALAGARIVSEREYILKNADILLTHSSDIDFTSSEKKKIVIGSYNVLDEYSSILQFKRNPIDFYALTLLPRTTKAQSMDILSSQAAMAGYQAVIQGFEKSNLIAPMISSAGGTLYPAKVLVLGAGVSGLQAIATAKRLGAIVHSFDIRKQTKTEVESLGAQFIEVEGAKEDPESGGYAIQQDEDFMTKVQNSIHTYSQNADLIITTARIPGKKAPILINGTMLKALKKGCIVIDLSAETGGNCVNIKNNEEIQLENALIIGASSLFNNVAQSTSILLGNNYNTFLNHFSENEDNSEDEILNATRVTSNGKIVHQRLIAEINKY